MSIEAKKIAIIKSNAAPEVKLKALEKLNAIHNNAVNSNKRKQIKSGKYKGESWSLLVEDFAGSPTGKRYIAIMSLNENIPYQRGSMVETGFTEDEAMKKLLARADKEKIGAKK